MALLPTLVVCALAMIAVQLGVPAPIDRTLLNTRLSLSHWDASGDVVVIAVDRQSLQEVGVWPWPRRVHGQLLDRLTRIGVRDVIFDFDFAFASDPTNDGAFVQSLERAGGTAYLPIFAQMDPMTGEVRNINQPLPAFAEVSEQSLINIHTGRDGIVRTYDFEQVINGTTIPSMGNILSGADPPNRANFPINFAIDPANIPTYPYSDVVAGRIPPEALRGKSIIVGAYALELRDTYATPLHGIIPGPMIHALAAETLISGAIPRGLSPLFILPLVALFTLLLQTQSRKVQTLALVRTTLVLLAVVELAAYGLFRETALILETGVLYFTVLLYGTWSMSRVLGVHKWLIEEKQAQLNTTVDILSQVFADASDAILVVDGAGRVLHYSKMAETVFGTGTDGQPILPEKLEWNVARAIASFQDNNWSPDGSQEISLTRGHDKRQVEYSITPSRIQPNLEGTAQHIATISARDVTDARGQAERIDYLSSHDERTGALRRTAFFRHLSRATSKGSKVAIFTINLHRFKTINVTLGREVGDQVLRQSVIRLQSHPAGFRQVLRLDGDSFAVFVSDFEDGEAVRNIAREIVRSLTRPFALKTSRAQVGVRVGFAMDRISPDVTGPVLLDRAEEALDQARTSAGNRIAGYDRDTASARIRSRAIEQAMGGAIAREEFSLLYQPQVTIGDSQLCGVEALVRWNHPDLGPIGPDEFIPIAESNGFIQDLGRWVLLRAMREGMLLPPHISLAVNVSPIQMMSNRIVKDVRQALDETGFQPERLWLELTESTLLTPNAMMLKMMADVEGFGAAWALDDFGTGFSSLSYMSNLPIRKLKVDRAFISKLGPDPSALAIIRSVQVMCDGLGIKMLCEGIETKAQAQILRAENCAEGQGYLYGKPLKMTEVLSRYARTRRIAS